MVSRPAAHLRLSIRTIHLNLNQPQEISGVNKSIEHKVAHLHRHILLLDLRVTHRFIPMGLQWAMFAMRIWKCTDYLNPHLHTNSS